VNPSSCPAHEYRNAHPQDARNGYIHMQEGIRIHTHKCPAQPRPRPRPDTQAVNKSSASIHISRHHHTRATQLPSCRSRPVGPTSTDITPVLCLEPPGILDRGLPPSLPHACQAVVSHMARQTLMTPMPGQTNVMMTQPEPANARQALVP